MKTWVCLVCKQVFEHNINHIPVESESGTLCVDCVVDLECASNEDREKMIKRIERND